MLVLLPYNPGEFELDFPNASERKKPRFYQTFAETSITGAIPANLFIDLTGAPVENMFYRTFYGDKKLTGYSVKSNGKYLYEIWPDTTSAQVGGMYSSCNKLSDYRSIPSAWR